MKTSTTRVSTSIGLLLAQLALGTGVHAGERALDRVRSEYLRGIRKLEERYRNVSGQGLRTGDSTGDGKGSTEYSFVVSGYNRKLTRRARGAGSSGQTYVYARNKDLTFKLVRRPPDGYVLEQYSRSSGRRDWFDQAIGDFLKAPSGFYGMNMTACASMSGFRLKDAEEVDCRGETCYKIHFEVKGSDGESGRPSPGFAGWVIASPKRDWATLEYNINIGSYTEPVTGIIDYADEGEPPTLRRVDHTNFGRDRRIFTFEDVTFGPNPDSCFSLRYFGLPDIDPVRRNSPAAYLLAVPWFAAALGFGLLAVLLHRLTARPAGATR